MNKLKNQLTNKISPLINKITPSYRTVEAVKGGLAILGIICVAGSFLYLWGSEALKGHDRAYNNLVQFSRSNNLIAGTCNQWDTDNDGTISCTATDKNGTFFQLVCGSNWLTENTASCNFPKLRVNNLNNNSN